MSAAGDLKAGAVVPNHDGHLLPAAAAESAGYLLVGWK